MSRVLAETKKTLITITVNVKYSILFWFSRNVYYKPEKQHKNDASVGLLLNRTK